MSKDRYEAVKPTTTTQEAIEAAREYWVKRHEENALALGISATRLIQLGIPIPGVDPDQLKLEIL